MLGEEECSLNHVVFESWRWRSLLNNEMEMSSASWSDEGFLRAMGLNGAELLELVGEVTGQPLWWPLPCGWMMAGHGARGREWLAIS